MVGRLPVAKMGCGDVWRFGQLDSITALAVPTSDWAVT